MFEHVDKKRVASVALLWAFGAVKIKVYDGQGRWGVRIFEK